MKSKRLNRQKGQELAEYALVLPIFLFIIFGIFDLGRAVYTYSAMQNSAREGTRYGIIYPEDWEGIQAMVLEKAVGLDPSKLAINVSLLPEDAIRVQLVYQFQPVTPFVPDLLGGSVIPLQSQATMQVER